MRLSLIFSDEEIQDGKVLDLLTKIIKESKSIDICKENDQDALEESLLLVDENKLNNSIKIIEDIKEEVNKEIKTKENITDMEKIINTNKKTQLYNEKTKDVQVKRAMSFKDIFNKNKEKFKKEETIENVNYIKEIIEKDEEDIELGTEIIEEEKGDVND